MNCIEFEAALEHQIQARSPLDPEAIAHAAVCAECRVGWELHRQLDTIILRWRRVEKPPELLDKVLVGLAISNNMSNEEPPHRVAPLLAAVSVGSNQRVSFSRGRFGALACSLASLILAIVVFSRFGKDDNRDLAGTSRPMIDQSISANSPIDLPLTLTEVFSDLRSEYRDLASETTSVARDLVNGLPVRVEVPVRPQPDVVVFGPTANDVGRIWRPIGSRVESALSFL